MNRSDLLFILPSTGLNQVSGGSYGIVTIYRKRVDGRVTKRLR